MLDNSVYLTRPDRPEDDSLIRYCPHISRHSHWSRRLLHTLFWANTATLLLSHPLIRWAGGCFRALGSFWWFPGKSNMAGWRNVGKSSTLKAGYLLRVQPPSKKWVAALYFSQPPHSQPLFLSCTYVIFQSLLVNSAFRWMFSPLSLEITSFIVQHRLNPPSFQISSH
jgi:hypothetical protein